MAITQNSEVVLLDLNVQDTIDLVLEPAFNYDNPLQNRFRHYLWKTGVQNKYRMIHLNKPGNMLQPKSDCNTWNPTINLGLRPYEIGTADYEVNGEQCPDEWDVACLRNMRDGDDPTFTNSPQLNAIEQAMIRQIRTGLVDDTYKIAEFGNENIRQELADGNINPILSPDNKENFLRMMEVQNGWWPEIIARTQTSSTDRFTHIKYVDTNDGTADGNATNPANIVDYLKQMRATADPILKYWNYNNPIETRPFYELQSAMFEALKTYYQTNNTLADNTYTIDGMGLNGVLMFDGFLVFDKAEWDMYDIETGNWDNDLAMSKIQRARFTVPENLCGLITAESLANRPQSALVIEADPSIKAKGKKYIYATYGYGFGIAQPVLMVAGYNTSQNFVF